MSKLCINDFSVDIAKKSVLHGINLTIDSGKIHLLIGPNGSGKSTLLNSILGNPTYQVTNGTLSFDDQNINELSTDQRARLGIYLGMQNPTEIPGVPNSDLIRSALTANNKTINVVKFAFEFEKLALEMGLDPSFAFRSVNEGFSGGEKKKNEIIQLSFLEPKIALLDEIDSGLDIDSIKKVAIKLQSLVDKGLGLLLVSHQYELLKYLNVTDVHVIIKGSIVKNGSKELLEDIFKNGFKQYE
jgi:Fe-S cluster assembly ATP-binding protein